MSRFPMGMGVRCGLCVLTPTHLNWPRTHVSCQLSPSTEASSSLACGLPPLLPVVTARGRRGELSTIFDDAREAISPGPARYHSSSMSVKQQQQQQQQSSTVKELQLSTHQAVKLDERRTAAAK